MAGREPADFLSLGELCKVVIVDSQCAKTIANASETPRSTVMTMIGVEFEKCM
jgi:hypothetical protein